MYGAVPAAPVKVIFGAVASLHTVLVPLIDAVGNGFTVTVTVKGVPVQVPDFGVTV